MEYLHTLLPAGTSTKLGMAGVWRHLRKDGGQIDVEIKWSPVSFKGRAAWLVMANDVTERKRIEHRDAALSKWGKVSVRRPRRRRPLASFAGWPMICFNGHIHIRLYSAEHDLVYPILNVDTDREGARFEIPVTALGRDPSEMAGRSPTRCGADPPRRAGVMSNDECPIGDTSRPSASLMLAPIRNRTKVIGILSVQSYALQAYNQQDLNTLQTLADHCGGALSV